MFLLILLQKLRMNLEKNEDFNTYSTLKDEIKTAILNEYFSPQGKISVTTQTGYILALYYGIYQDKDVLIQGYNRRLMFDSYKLKTGFTGTP